MITREPEGSHEQLEEQVTELAGHIHAATARWLKLVAEADRQGVWHGHRSPAEWLTYRCGLDPAAAREQIKVAHRLSDLPLIAAAFEEGEISYWQVRALARVATPENEETLLDWTRHSMADQMQRICRRYETHLNSLSQKRNYESRYLRYFFDDSGSLVLSARLPGEEGALVAKALELAREEVSATTRPEVPAHEEDIEELHERAPGLSCSERRYATMADALVAVAETSLTESTGSKSVDPPTLVVHADLKTLMNNQGAAEVDGSVGIPATAVRRLACDAAVVTIVEDPDGKPLNVGRKTRTVPPALRRALESRDRICRFPGCGQRRRRHAHHLQHWLDDGEHEPENLILLCRFHHRLVHDGGYEVTGDPSGEVTFIRPNGDPVPNHPQTRGSEAGLRRLTSERNITADTCRSHWDGIRPNYRYILDILDELTRAGPESSKF